MNFKTIFSFCAFLIFASACSNKKPKSTNTIDHLNIIFVIADDLDFDEVNFYDRENFPSYTNDYLNGRESRYRYTEDSFIMPTLDKLAKEGAVFNRFYTPSPVCTPSRFVTLTGKYAHQDSSVPDSLNKEAKIAFDVFLEPSVDNIAKSLNALGYTTAYFGKYHNGINNGHIYLLGNEAPYSVEDYQQRKENYPRFKAYLQDSIGFKVADRLMSENQSMLNKDWIDEGVGKFIDSHASDPFFMYISLPIPHGYYWPTDRIDTRYTSEGEVTRGYDIENDFDDANRQNWFNSSSSLGTWLDGTLTNLMGKLEEHNLDENTLIIFTSDHQSRGKMTVYESARVPTLFWMPDRIKPHRIEDLGSFLDLVPTVLSFAGDTNLDQYEGINLEPLLTKQEQIDRDYVFLECSYFRGVSSKKWKYIENPTGQIDENFLYDNAKVFPHYKEQIQLYDLSVDFAEQHNLAGLPEYQDIQNEMALKLKGFLKQ